MERGCVCLILAKRLGSDGKGMFYHASFLTAESSWLPSEGPSRRTLGFLGTIINGYTWVDQLQLQHGVGLGVPHDFMSSHSKPLYSNIKLR